MTKNKTSIIDEFEALWKESPQLVINNNDPTIRAIHACRFIENYIEKKRLMDFDGKDKHVLNQFHDETNRFVLETLFNSIMNEINDIDISAEGLRFEPKCIYDKNLIAFLKAYIKVNKHFIENEQNIYKIFGNINEMQKESNNSVLRHIYYNNYFEKFKEIDPDMFQDTCHNILIDAHRLTKYKYFKSDEVINAVLDGKFNLDDPYPTNSCGEDIMSKDYINYLILLKYYKDENRYFEFYNYAYKLDNHRSRILLDDDKLHMYNRVSQTIVDTIKRSNKSASSKQEMIDDFSDFICQTFIEDSPAYHVLDVNCTRYAINTLGLWQLRQIENCGYPELIKEYYSINKIKHNWLTVFLSNIFK